MELTRDGDQLRATDESKTSISVGVPGWQPAESGPAIPDAVDGTAVGRADRLEFPPVFATARDLDTDETTRLGSEVGEVDLPDGEYVIRVSGPLVTFVRFTGPATLARPDYERTVLRFPEATTVTLGFRSLAQSPPETIVVPRTPAGVATALSLFPAGHRTATPDRTFPTMRGHPPLVEFGASAEVPDAVRDRRESTGVSMRLPADLEYLLPASSMAHYVGAEVSVASGARPSLTAGDHTVRFGTDREFEREVADTLRRVFLLDCLVRGAGPHGADVAEQSLLPEVGLEADALYDRPMDERVRAYLTADFDAIADRLPEWHLAMYVAPTYENIRSLPYMVFNVPYVFRPRVASLAGADRLTHSLDDFYRYEADAPTVELVQAELGPGRYHGWLAEGVPIDVFKSLPEAFRNRADYSARADEPISLVAVLNDSEMGEEHTEAARIYRERAHELDIDIDIRERLTTDELARTFETKHDLVHYIGHCEEGGLRCADGHLPVSSISKSRTQTFFLNACGSYHEGVELVRKGSIAGAVTFNKVLDAQAARVGTAFARLVVHGYAIERALDLARRRIIMGKDYAVVGDGTHVLTQTEVVVGGEARLSAKDDGRFDLAYTVQAPWTTGASFQPHLSEAGQRRLLGSTVEFDMDRDEVADFLDYALTPVIYDGDLHWSEELAAELRPASDGQAGG